MNEKIRPQKVSPAENACVDYAKAIGPRDVDNTDDIQLFESLWKRIDPESPVPVGPFYDDGDKADLKIYDRMASPWEAKDFPAAKEWIDQNEKPLELIVKGSHKPVFYYPLFESKQGGGTETCLLPLAQKIRSAGQCLVARSMNHLARDEIDACLNDLSAARRLAKHIASGGLIIEQMVGVAITQSVAKAELAVIRSKKLTQQSIKDYLKVKVYDHQALENYAKSFLGERWLMREMIEILIKEGKENSLSKSRMAELREAVDVGDGLYDFVDQAFANPQDYRSTIKGIAKANAAHTIIVQTLTGMGKRAAGKVAVAKSYAAVGQLHNMTVRHLTRNRQIECAFHLELHRLKTGEFPDKLSELIFDANDDPSCLIDPYSGKQFLYVKSDADSLMLYSVGSNLIDNGGVGTKESWDLRTRDFGFSIGE